MRHLKAFLASAAFEPPQPGTVCCALSDDVGAIQGDIGAFNLGQALGQFAGMFGGGGRRRHGGAPRYASGPPAAPQGWRPPAAPQWQPQPYPQQMMQPQYGGPAPYYGPPPFVSPLQMNSIPGGIYGAGFPNFLFNNALGLGALTFTLNPIAALKGRRFTITLIRSGASAATTTPMVTQLMAGAVPMILGNPVAADTFSPTAQDTNLTLPPIAPGQFYQLTMALPVALAAGDTILALPALTGDA